MTAAASAILSFVFARRSSRACDAMEPRARYRRALAAIFAFFFLLFGTGTQQASAKRCGPFHFLKSTHDLVKQQHANSLLLLRSGDQEGTGFLIDALQGLFLTARHVVASSIADSSIPVSGTDASGQPVKLEVVDNDAKYDVALLRTIDFGKFRNETAFELSFDSPWTDTKITFPGLAFATDVDVTPTMPVPNTFVYNAAGNIILRTQVRSGDSGSPVFTDRGMVIGIMIRNQTSDQAVVVPVEYLRTFLLKHVGGIPGHGESPAEKFRDLILHESNGSELEDKLLPNKVPPQVSNFQLAGTIHLLIDGKMLHRIQAKLLDCPLYEAAYERGLGRVAAELYAAQKLAFAQPLVDQPGPDGAALAARKIFAMAEAEARVGNSRAAQFLYEDAAKTFSVAIQKSLDQTQGKFAVVLAGGASEPQEAARRVTKAYDQLQLVSTLPSFQTVPASAKRSDKFGVLLHDFYEATKRSAKLSPRGLTKQESEKLMVAAGWTAVVSKTDTWSALGYRALGDVLAADGKYDAAAKSYATAWQKGLNNKSVLNDFGFVKLKASDTDVSGPKYFDAKRILDETALTKDTTTKLLFKTGDIKY